MRVGRLVQVRGLLAGTFNRLVKAVALVAGEDCDEGLAGSRVTCALVGQGATVAGDESDNEVERDGEVGFGYTKEKQSP